MSQEFINKCIDIAAQREADKRPRVHDYNKCVYRTGDKWPAQPELRPIYDHPLKDSWDTLGKQIYEFLDSLKVRWSGINPVRFVEEREKADTGTLCLWVLVEPGSLSIEDAKTAGEGCKKILTDANFPDVEIAFRESVRWPTFPPGYLSGNMQSNSNGDSS
jgi:hypothetical protein